MEITKKLVNETIQKFQHPSLSFSGGGDSMVLLAFLYTKTEHRPPVIWVDSQMEYPETEPFIIDVCKRYGAELHIARSKRTPIEQWEKQGWPMLGKLAARIWMRHHKGRDFGIKIDVSSCCRNLKIAPGRNATKEIGGDLQITGIRGNEDDSLRGMRALKDSAVKYVKADKLTIFNPLTGWTDLMIRRYTKTNNLPIHPRKKSGAITIGCMYCGGGAQFTNSGFRILRKTAPDLWRAHIVCAGAGEIILSIKYDQPLSIIRPVIKRMGGIEALYDKQPWLFDFLELPPRQGYDK